MRTAGFTGFNRFARPALFAADKIRVFGPGATTVAQDIEPEYITISEDSRTAWVTLQENNAVAIIDIRRATVRELLGLGTKNHSLSVNRYGSGNGLDASDQDGPKVPDANGNLVATPKINIQNWPVQGLYLPDGIASYKVGSQTYLVLANEGDVRAWGTFNEEKSVSSVALDPTAFPDAATLKKNENLGRLKITNANGDTDGAGDFDQLFSFGARSFSIRTTDGDLVWDSGDQFERITAARYPANFNASNSSNSLDNRSDDKGPEPEGITIGNAFGSTYAFVVLERIGGVMTFDISNPRAPTFADYANHRDFSVAPPNPLSGDRGPEGVIFIEGDDSPNGKPLVVVANEISGTTAIYEVNKRR